MHKPNPVVLIGGCAVSAGQGAGFGQEQPALARGFSDHD